MCELILRNLFILVCNVCLTIGQQTLVRSLFSGPLRKQRSPFSLGFAGLQNQQTQFYFSEAIVWVR
nr:MAG TPA: hypothetical protein [Caudoviricetes sp.]